MDILILQWGTLHNWRIETPESRQILSEYLEARDTKTFRDTGRAKELLVKLIQNSRYIYLESFRLQVSKADALDYIGGKDIELPLKNG